MVPMIMGEDRFFNIGQSMFRSRALQHRPSMATCVQQNAVTIGLYQRGETPFTQTRKIAHQHGGKHGDFKRMDLRRQRGNAPWREPGLSPTSVRSLGHKAPPQRKSRLNNETDFSFVHVVILDRWAKPVLAEAPRDAGRSYGSLNSLFVVGFNHVARFIANANQA